MRLDFSPQALFQTSLQCILYALGPFFCYPWKPIINGLYNNDYETAYTNFHRDHSDPLNLILHTVCLIFQLLTNFGLLHLIDQSLPAFLSVYSPMSRLTYVIWSVYLYKCAKTRYNTHAILLLSVAYMLAAYVATVDILYMIETLVMLIYFVTILTYTFMRYKVKSFWLNIGAAFLCYGWITVWYYIERYCNNLFVNYAWTINIINVLLAVVMIITSASEYVPQLPVIVGAVLCRIVFVLTGQPIVFALGCAFTAPLLQGLSHKITGEMATLINHNRIKIKSILSHKTKLEYGHVTYFPVLAINAVMESWAKKVELSNVSQ